MNLKIGTWPKSKEYRSARRLPCAVQLQALAHPGVAQEPPAEFGANSIL